MAAAATTRFVADCGTVWARGVEIRVTWHQRPRMRRIYQCLGVAFNLVHQIH